MSDSITKYHEQRGVRILCEILSASSKADLVQELVAKAFEVSIKNGNLSPVTVFQIAADEVKVDELCNKIK